MEKTIIRQAMIVGPEKVEQGDLLIEEGKIKKIAPHLEEDLSNEVGVKEIFADGHYLLAGGIDAHTHLELPQMGTFTCDDFDHGSKVALFGGTTSIIDFANQKRGESLKKTITDSKKRAYQRTHCDYSFHLSVTDVCPATLSELKAMMEEEGITSFKTFMAYDQLMLKDEDFILLMKEIKALGGLVTLHAEVGAMVSSLIDKHHKEGKASPRYWPSCHPPESEYLAISKAITFAKEIGASLYIVHISTKEGAALVESAKKEGYPIYGETCPQYLLLDESLAHGPKEKVISFIMAPPFRTKEHREGIWEVLLRGGVDVLATDHAPFTYEQKLAGQFDFSKTPHGACGLEERFLLFYSKAVCERGMTLVDFSKVISLNPAKIFGLYPQKGAIVEGFDADLVLLDPKEKTVLTAKSLHSKALFTPYEGEELSGAITHVFLRGELMVERGKWVGPLKGGRFLKRPL